MGRPVVHFEILGDNTELLHSFYSELFEWNINADNPMKYGIVEREENLNADGIGIGGGVAGMPGSPGHVTFYVEVPDVARALAMVGRLGGSVMMGPETVMDGVEIGLFADPEGHVVGVIKATE